MKVRESGHDINIKQSQDPVHRKFLIKTPIAGLNGVLYIYSNWGRHLIRRFVQSPVILCMLIDKGRQIHRRTCSSIMSNQVGWWISLNYPEDNIIDVYREQTTKCSLNNIITLKLENNWCLYSLVHLIIREQMLWGHPVTR